MIGGTRTRRRVLLAVAVSALAVAGCSGGGAHPHAGPTFGPLPKFLSKATTLGHRVVDASSAKSALASQGDQVRVHAPGGVVLAEVAGPKVPVSGVVPEPTYSNATFDVTLSGVSGRVPLSLAMFTSLDDMGRTFPLTVVPGSPALPATIATGQTVTTKLEAVLPVGEGLLQWSPSGKVLSAWDFEVEVD